MHRQSTAEKLFTQYQNKVDVCLVAVLGSSCKGLSLAVWTNTMSKTRSTFELSHMQNC